MTFWIFRVIDHQLPTHISPPRVYPPVPETHQPQIYSTIDQFPKDLLPKIPELATAEKTYAQQYQNVHNLTSKIFFKFSSCSTFMEVWLVEDIIIKLFDQLLQLQQLLQIRMFQFPIKFLKARTHYQLMY